jgi:DNA replication protein DnaC
MGRDMTANTTASFESLALMMKTLRLPAFTRYAEETAKKAEREGWTFGQFLYHLAVLEVDERRLRRIKRFLEQSQLPREKTLATLDRSRLPPKVQKLLPSLCEGSFIDRGENILAFGLPGRGKTHLACAIGHELVQCGRRIYFTPTYALVQRLLGAKRDLRLEKEMAALDNFDAVILDDIGYVQQHRDEMEVLFTFLSERYERKSVIITSNLVFSEWGRIFQDPMTAAAAIDRLIHHATIVEMTGPSIRSEEAKKRGLPTTTTPTTTTNAVQSGREAVGEI